MFEIISVLDHRASAFGADGLCYKKSNYRNIVRNRLIVRNELHSNSQVRLRKHYGKLVNCLCCTDDIAAKLFEAESISSSELQSVQNERNNTRKNELLLNVVQQSDENVFDIFMNSLQETQSNIFLLLRDELDFSLDHVKLIQHNYRFLVENIDTSSGLLDLLLQSQCLTGREVKEIESKETTHKINQELLSLLMMKNFSIFSNFIEALKNTKQSCIADKLNSKYKCGSESTTGDFREPVDDGNKCKNDLLQEVNQVKNYNVGQKLMNKINRDFNKLPDELQLTLSLKIIARDPNCTSNQHISCLLRHLKDIYLEVITLRREKQTVDYICHELTEDLKTMKLKMDEQIKTIVETDKKLKQTEAEHEMMKEDKDLIANKRRQLSADLTLSENKLVNCRSEIIDLQQQLRSSSNVIEELTGKLRGEELKRATLSKKESDLRAELKKVEFEKDKIERDHNLSNNDKGQLYEEVKQLRMDHEKCNVENINFRQEIQTFLKKEEKLSAELKSERQERVKLMKSISVLRDESTKNDKARKQFQENLLLISNENSEFRAKVEQLKNELEKCKREYDDLRQKREQLVRKNQELSSDLNDKEQCIQKQVRTITVERQEKEKLRINNKNIADARDAINIEKIILHAKFEQTKNELDSLKRENEHLCKKHHTLSKQIEEFTAELRSGESAKEHLSSKLTETRIKFKTSEEEKKRIEMEKDLLRNAKHQQLQEVKQLQNDLTNSKQEINNLRREKQTIVETTEERLAELIDELLRKENLIRELKAEQNRREGNARELGKAKGNFGEFPNEERLLTELQHQEKENIHDLITECKQELLNFESE